MFVSLPFFQKRRRRRRDRMLRTKCRSVQKYENEDWKNWTTTATFVFEISVEKREKSENILFEFSSVRYNNISNNISIFFFYHTFFCRKMCIQSLSMAFGTHFAVVASSLPADSVKSTMHTQHTYGFWRRSAKTTLPAICDGTKCQQFYGEQQRRSPVVIMYEL